MSKVTDALFGIGVAAGTYAIDKLFSSSDTKTSNVPVPVPPSQTGSKSPTIPTSAPAPAPARSRSRLDDLFEVVSTSRALNNEVLNNINTTNVTVIENITNNYNQVTNNITNNSSTIQQSTSLLDVLKANGEGSALVAKGLAELTAVNASGSANIVAVGGAVYSKLDDIQGALYAIASAIYENGLHTAPVVSSGASVINSFDTAPIVTALSQLSEVINPPSRVGFYETSKAVNDFKLSPAPISDIFGNDTVTLSPIALQAKKDLAVAHSHGLENSTTMNDISLDDIIEEDSLLSDAMKLFKNNGIASNLTDLMSKLSTGATDFIPNVDLKV